MSFYCKELPYQPDAANYYAAIADLPYAAWLDSGGMARFDILTALPHHTLDGKDGCADPFSLIRRELGERIAPVENVPFAGGALGYWSYDLARQMINPPDGHEKDAGQLPCMAIGIYDWALVLDHQKKTARLVSHQRFPETEVLLVQILQHLHAGGHRALSPDSDGTTSHPTKPASEQVVGYPPLAGERGKDSLRDAIADTFSVQGKITSNFTRAGYAAAFARVQDYLQAGDCYQVNLAQRFSASATGDALPAYLKLRQLSPAPYSVYLDFPEVQILCASPERFVSVHDGLVETRPIKGTRPRDSDPVRDAKLACELSLHPKDRAENLMIVDLLRNDLGKCCIPGSVVVPQLFEVESYANVHHLVSTVQGKLAEGQDALDVLRGCFPGGSITGAPKLRAMQIIDELEPDLRGVYCGAIGYVGFDGNMDSNIVIRTLVYSRGKICCWAGGGLVADSVCDAEYQETLDKASAMLELLRLYGGEL
jgi:para-aminobenzoate synthetase component I